MLCQYGIVGLKLNAGTLAAATTALAIMNYQDGKPAAAAFEPVRNETVIYRQASLSIPVAREAEPAAEFGLAPVTRSAPDPPPVDPDPETPSA